MASSASSNGPVTAGQNGVIPKMRIKVLSNHETGGSSLSSNLGNPAKTRGKLGQQLPQQQKQQPQLRANEVIISTNRNGLIPPFHFQEGSNHGNGMAMYNPYIGNSINVRNNTVGEQQQQQQEQQQQQQPQLQQGQKQQPQLNASEAINNFNRNGVISPIQIQIRSNPVNGMA